MTENLKNAVNILCKALAEDKDYYYSWQANIAVQFQDEMRKDCPDSRDIHSISNEAAKSFLNLLISQDEYHSKKDNGEGI